MGSSRVSPVRVLIPVGLGTALALLGDTGLYTVLPSRHAEAGILLGSVGILLSINRWVRLASNGAAGWLADRLPRRWIFVPSLFLGAVSTLSYALSHGFWPMFAGRILWGIAWSGIWVAGNAIIFDISDDQTRGRWVGIYQISFFSGAAAGSMISGVLTDLIGYHSAMGAAAGLTALGAVIALLFLPETNHADRREETALAIAAAAASPKPRESSAAELLSATSLLGVNRIVVAGMLLSTFGVYLLDMLGETVILWDRSVGVATLTGIGLGVSTFSGILFTPLIGSISDRVSSRWLVVAGGLAAGIVGLSLLALAQPAAAVIGLPLVFLASSSNQGLSTALMGDLSAGKRQGRRLGMLFTVGDLGSAIGPPLAYAILPVWRSSGIYWVGALLFAAMFLVAARWSVLRYRAVG